MSAPVAIVMNMFYTGLGIARSLGEAGIPVIGLSAQKGIYGNYTRYAKTMFCPDSRSEPEALLQWLLDLGRTLDTRGVIFPTRDDDAVFLDRFREQLEPYFILALAPASALGASLNKWETYDAALSAGVAVPKCWLIEREEQLLQALDEVRYPCVLKPVSAHHWRAGGNWNVVGGRKAIGVISQGELMAEYAAITRADNRVLLQEMIPGGDECLVVVACYFDRQSNCLAWFNARKLIQIPEGFGTGCIVQTADVPELLGPTTRLLKHLRFAGIAEVEYKWDATDRQYKLIEINPRPWDQHRLGNACGVDLMQVAYRDYTGQAQPLILKRSGTKKWIAEDAFLMAALRLLWRRDPGLGSLLRMARGSRIFGIWAPGDPLPFLVYMTSRFLPWLFADAARTLVSKAVKRLVRGESAESKGRVYEGKSVS